MRETLYIRLGISPDAELEFGVCGAELRSLKTQKGLLSEAATHAPGRRLVLFFPADEVRLTSVKVPAKQTAKVLQAVPYALEDQVADDIEDLHFAIGPRQPDTRYPVAIISRKRLDQWLASIRLLGLHADAMVPENLALPVSGNGSDLSALVDGEQVLVRHGPWSGFVCAREDLASFLEIVDTEKSSRLQLFVSGANKSDWSQLEWPLQLMPTPSPLHTLANHYRADHAINLLQGSYSQSRDLQRHWTPWRLTASLLLAFFVIAGLAHALDVLRLSRALEQQDQANIARFQQLFPDQQRIENLEAQLDQKIRSMASNGAAGPFDLLQTLAEALAASPGLRLRGMQYRDGALYLSLTAKDLQVLDKLRDWFESRPDTQLQVQSANAEQDGAQIRAKLQAS